MRRKRYMKGSLRQRKHGRHRLWMAQWWEDGSRRTKVLGKCTELTKGQAEAMLASILHPLNQTAGMKQVRPFTFKEFVEEVYLPVCRRKWKESTRSTSENTIQLHLVNEFEHYRIREISRDQMQIFLDKMARTHSHSIVAHLRWHLSGIFKMAMSDGAVDLNPTLGLYTPACKAAPEKRVLSKEDIRTALEVLDLRERLMFRMAVFDGMRPGEILAIQLSKIAEHSVLIDQRVYRGTIDTPKGRKGKRTSRVVALSPGTLADLKAWSAQCTGQTPDAFLFPSESGATTMRRDNIWRRNLGPKLATVGLEWATFQVLRRTNASLSRKANIDDKVAADQRGHGLGVSLEVYSISDLQQKIEAVKKLESEVIQ
jgi:integrase